MNKLGIFFKLTKVDMAKRTVEGIATAEMPDKTGEICDYESTKPYYQKWSDGFKKATDGKSLGNLRAMHTSIAAGKLTNIFFDDAQKAIRIVAKVVDDAEWNKVMEGVYTGFSQGGEYVNKWQDGDHVRYTADPSEVSLVDNPCLGEATFEIIKANGAVEMRKFHVEQELTQGWRAKDGSFHLTKREAEKANIEIDIRKQTEPAQKQLADAQELLEKAEVDEYMKREFTDEERKKAADAGEAMPDGSFPIKNEADLKNAIRAVGRASDPAKAKAHIIARAKALELTNLLPSEWEGSTQKSAKVVMTKDLGIVARAACLIDELQWLMTAIKWEEDMEDDTASDAPNHMQDIVKELCDFLTSYAAEECSEIVEANGGTGIELPMAMSAVHVESLTKHIANQAFRDQIKALVAKAKAEADAADTANAEHVGAIHKAAANIMQRCMKCMGKDMEMFLKAVGEETATHIKAMHKKAGDIADRCMKMGSNFKPDGDTDDGDDDDHVTKLFKSEIKTAALTKSLGEMNAMVEKLMKRIDHLEKQPAPRKGAVFSVEKGHEVTTGEPDEAVNTSISLKGLRLSPEETRKALFG